MLLLYAPPAAARFAPEIELVVQRHRCACPISVAGCAEVRPSTAGPRRDAPTSHTLGDCISHLSHQVRRPHRDRFPREFVIYFHCAHPETYHFRHCLAPRGPLKMWKWWHRLHVPTRRKPPQEASDQATRSTPTGHIRCWRTPVMGICCASGSHRGIANGVAGQ